MRGRFNFTLAHEIGHWCLHRGRDEVRLATGNLFGAPAAPSIICRTSERRERIEIQADAFAGCLLMPRDLLVPAWRRRAGRGRRDDVVEPTVRRLAEEFEVSPRRCGSGSSGWAGRAGRDVETTEPLFGAA
jgi:Zn-dependent peptidase ImmA (M78 family)